MVLTALVHVLEVVPVLGMHKVEDAALLEVLRQEAQDFGRPVNAKYVKVKPYTLLFFLILLKPFAYTFSDK